MTAILDLGDLERLALERLLAGPHPLLGLLRRQIGHVRVRSQETTRSGFVVRFEVAPEAVPLPDRKGFQILDLYGSLKGSDGEVGFILFVEDGRLAALEGQILEGEWPERPVLERVYYMHPRSEGTANLVETPVRDLAFALAGSPVVEAATVRIPLPTVGGKRDRHSEEAMEMSRTTQFELGGNQTQRIPDLGLGGSPDPKPGETSPPEPEPADGRLPTRRLIYLVGFQVFLGTCTSLALYFLIPSAPYHPDPLAKGLHDLESGLLQTYLMSTLGLVLLAGAAGGVLASFLGLFRLSRRGGEIPAHLEVPYYLRPLFGALNGLAAFLGIHLLIAGITAGLVSLSWVTLPGRMAFVALALLAGFAAEESTDKLKDVARTIFSIRSDP